MSDYTDKISDALKQMESGITPTSDSYSEALIVLASVDTGASGKKHAANLIRRVSP